jgi:hypothetical protein
MVFIWIEIIILIGLRFVLAMTISPLRLFPVTNIVVADVQPI